MIRNKRLLSRNRKSFTQPPFWSLDHPLYTLSSSLSGEERIGNDFESYVSQAFKDNGTIFACMVARQLVFSEARFLWRRFENGRPTDLFGDQSLGIIETPWPQGTTGQLLSRMDQDASLAGNFWGVRVDDQGRFGRNATGSNVRIFRMRPDWVTVVIDAPSGHLLGPDAQPVGVLYKPPAVGTVQQTEWLIPYQDVMHYAPIPDPVRRFVGMSWLTPIVKEIESDTKVTRHKNKFFDNAAVPNIAVKFDKETSPEAFQNFVENFKSTHQGSWNAYKTLFLMGGADVTPLTQDFKQMELSQTQGKSESRVASAAGVPPSWVGFSEGLQGSALNAGNFAAARRRFADGTIRPLWRIAAAALQQATQPRDSNRSLWYDDRDIAFLREDQKDIADIQFRQASALRQMVDAGFEPSSSVQSIANDDFRQLQHTGLFSVQLHPPGSTEADNSQSVNPPDIEEDTQ